MVGAEDILFEHFVAQITFRSLFFLFQREWLLLGIHVLLSFYLNMASCRNWVQEIWKAYPFCTPGYTYRDGPFFYTPFAFGSAPSCWSNKIINFKNELKKLSVESLPCITLSNLSTKQGHSFSNQTNNLMLPPFTNPHLAVGQVINLIVNASSYRCN